MSVMIKLKIRFSRVGMKYCEIKDMPMTIENRTKMIMRKNISNLIFNKDDGMK